MPYVRRKSWGGLCSVGCISVQFFYRESVEKGAKQMAAVSKRLYLANKLNDCLCVASMLPVLMCQTHPPCACYKLQLSVQLFYAAFEEAVIDH